MEWIKINGCDFNAKIIATLSFENFKREGEFSFCLEKSEEELQKIYDQIIAVSKPKEDGNDSRAQTEVIKPARKGSANSGAIH